MSNAPIPRKSLRAKVQEHRAHNRRGLGLRAFASGFRPFAAVDGADGGDPHSGDLRQINNATSTAKFGHIPFVLSGAAPAVATLFQDVIVRDVFTEVAGLQPPPVASVGAGVTDKLHVKRSVGSPAGFVRAT
jgi:hypothetical protein